MKILSIFKKNLKIVSRNWSYFAVLFICPILLILISGIMLNSTDFNNLRIGVADEDPDYTLNLKDLRNSHEYNSLAECMYDLTNQKNSVCFHIREVEGITQIDVYIDNTVKIVEYYAKQYILDNVLSEQTRAFYRTTEELNARLAVYSSSILDTKKELQEAKAELEDQERILTEYRENLTQIRSDFDEVYWPIKNMEPAIKELKNNFSRNKQDLQNNITEFRNKKQEIQSTISIMEVFLSSRLTPADYSYVKENLDAISVSLDQIDSSLTGVENIYFSPELSLLINNLDLIIANLDAIKGTLDRLDSDLALSIQRTQNSKARIESFIVRLDEVSAEMGLMSESLNKDPMNLDFRNAFDVSGDPVFLAFPILVTIIIVFTSLVLSNMFILKQVNQPSHLRDLISPARDIHFLIADYLTNLFFVSVQVGILFLIGIFWFNLSLEIITVFIISLVLASSVLIFIGMSLGYLVKQQNLSILITISFLMLLFIFSDLIVPSVLAGPIVKFFIELNIFVILNKLLTESLVLHRPLSLLTSLLIKLTILLIGSAVIAYLSRKISKENEVHKKTYGILILLILILGFIVSVLQHEPGIKLAEDFLRILGL